MMKIIQAFLFSLVSLFCYAQDEIDTAKYDQDFELGILANYLEKNHYQFPSYQNFREKCIQYFNIDIATISENYYQGIGSDGYVLSIDKKFLSTYYESIFYNPNTLEPNFTLKQAKAALEKDDNSLSEKMIFFNRLLFQDDHSDEVNTYFLNTPESLLEVVVWFDYEDNQILNNQVVNYIETNELFHHTSIIHLLFYNNSDRGYKKNLLDELYTQKGISPIIQLSDAYYKYWNKLKVNQKYWDLEITQKNKDGVLFYLVGLIIKHKDNKIDYHALGMGYLSEFIQLDNELLNRSILQEIITEQEFEKLLKNESNF